MALSKFDELTCIVLEYREPGWTEKTLKSLGKARVPSENIIFADREGVGSISKAFNRAIEKVATKYAWFLTNVTFAPGMPASLIDALNNSQAIAVHPAFDSDHGHIRSAKGVEYAPFIEWTAPAFDMACFHEIGLCDEQLPYWGMDLDWSHRANQVYESALVIDGRFRLNHTYLRHSAPHPISVIRRNLRALYDGDTKDRLTKKYGKQWQKTIWPETAPA